MATDAVTSPANKAVAALVPAVGELTDDEETVVFEDDVAKKTSKCEDDGESLHPKKTYRRRQHPGAHLFFTCGHLRCDCLKPGWWSMVTPPEVPGSRDLFSWLGN